MTNVLRTWHSCILNYIRNKQMYINKLFIFTNGLPECSNLMYHLSQDTFFVRKNQNYKCCGRDKIRDRPLYQNFDLTNWTWNSVWPTNDVYISKVLISLFLIISSSIFQIKFWLLYQLLNFALRTWQNQGPFYIFRETKKKIEK